MKSKRTALQRGWEAAASKAVRRRSIRLPACPSLEGMASLDLGFAEYWSRRWTFSAELICMAINIGSLLPSSRIDGLALCCKSNETATSSPDLSASQRGDTSGMPKSLGEQQAQSKACTVFGNS